MNLPPSPPLPPSSSFSALPLSRRRHRYIGSTGTIWSFDIKTVVSFPVQRDAGEPPLLSWFLYVRAEIVRKCLRWFSTGVNSKRRFTRRPVLFTPPRPNLVDGWYYIYLFILLDLFYFISWRRRRAELLMESLWKRSLRVFGGFYHTRKSCSAALELHFICSFFLFLFDFNFVFALGWLSFVSPEQHECRPNTTVCVRELNKCVTFASMYSGHGSFTQLEVVFLPL